MSKTAIVGVTGSLGREFLSILEENSVKSSTIFAVDTNSPLGTQVSYGEDEDIDVFNLEDFDFSSVTAAVFMTSEEVAKHYIPRALSKNVKVIDCSGAYVMDTDVPLVVSGINDEDVWNRAKKGIIALPSPQVTQILVALQKTTQSNKITRLVINAYVSASVYGKEAMDELFTQTRKIFMNEPLVDDEQVFKKQIAFNVLPQVSEFIGEETKFEWSYNAEIKKILGTDIKVHANCAFVPTFIGIGEFVNVECENEVDVDEIRNAMRETKGVVVFDKHVDCGYVSVNDVQGEDDVYVSRLRQDISVENGFSFWCVADNLRACTARNAYNLFQMNIKK
ncbi:MAG: aspartate-semialdehyde dehydrogenase [Alphaproteobacteria bacterium]|nr:aspartate-semialdehyde dehydrogenase [Alphaproteobacteria bacterium]